jgi:3-methylcrotonyl-CoA carboxylase alpha subunit
MSAMFRTVLIANRGEIACRIVRTCRRLGIRSIAVYTDIDRNALHVERADDAFRIASYLDAASVIDAAKAAGAEAIHPGYGFLSENAAFAEACAAAGIAFIGPTSGAIRAMGDKDAAKDAVARAGVPVVPGYHGAQDVAAFRTAARRIGYPVLVKPVAGGGGKGMHGVAREDALAEALAVARREARSSFGDDRLLIEKLIERPRHVEVQVFGDSHGNLVHLFARDCSVQRRHQKVIEEAPVDHHALFVAAVAAARAVAYVNAGTVEFLFAPNGEFYFLEMNTRLQVEHPVTEAVTGLDLVEWQLRVAAGETLPLRQGDIHATGHAIEARIYAEDPARDFMPAPGRITYLQFPKDARIDTGVRAGDTIPFDYDPMIAKLIVHGKDRPEAVARLADALEQTRIAGIATNVEFLAAIARHSAFAHGPLDTGFIARELAALVPAAAPASEEELHAAAGRVLADRAAATREAAARSADPFSPWARADGWQLNDAPHREVQLVDGDRVVRVGGNPSQAAALEVVRAGDVLTVFAAGRRHDFRLFDSFTAAASHVLSPTLTAPMPGVITAVHVAPGAAVEQGVPLVSLEAMKVEHTIRAPAAGTVDAIQCKVGDRVSEGAELVVFTARKQEDR